MQASSNREPHVFANKLTTVLGIFLTIGTSTVHKLRSVLNTLLFLELGTGSAANFSSWFEPTGGFLEEFEEKDPMPVP